MRRVVRDPIRWMLPFFLGLCAGAQELPRGQVIDAVAANGQAGQSYALYVPSRYTPQKRWPILYAFDPAARGKIPVELYREAAERYGYIVAGSNNSQNGPLAKSSEAATAMWNDTHRRFAIDPQQTYLTGFSGGARVASAIAMGCRQCAAGVIVHGAGLPPNSENVKSLPFALFATVGEFDPNFPEMVRLQRQLESSDSAHRFFYHSGEHQWAPEDVALTSIEWLELLSMKSNRRERDESFVADQWKKRTGEAEAKLSAHDVYGAAQALGDVARDFEGLHDVAVVRERAVALRKTKEFRKGEGVLKEQLAEQERLEAPLITRMREIETSSDSRAFHLQELKDDLRSMKKAADAGGDDGKVRKRAMSGLLIYCMEETEAHESEKNYAAAIATLDVIRVLSKRPTGAIVESARLYAKSGDSKSAVRRLREAVRAGWRDASVLNGEDFQRLRGNVEFEKIVAEVGMK